MDKSFLWGCSSTAYQSEGAAAEDGKGPSVWDVFAGEPGRTFGDTDGRVGVDFYHRWEEDLDLMQKMGLKLFHFSVSWPRVLPAGRGAVNEAGLAFYDKIVDGCRARGIEPMITLFHWDLPQALEEAYGGWESPQCIDDFLAYAKLLYEHFQGRVNYWITINEANIYTSHGWLSAMHPPAKFDERQLFFRVNHHLFLAHAKALLLGKRIMPDAKIGASFAYGPGYAFDCDPRNAEARQDFDELENYWWLDVYCMGDYPQVGEHFVRSRGEMPDVTAEDRALFKEAADAMDFIGVNYYHSNVCEFNPPDGAQPFGYPNITGTEDTKSVTGFPGLYKNPPNPYLHRTDWDWTIDATGLKIACRELTSRYRLPVFITENGLGHFDRVEPDGKIHDGYRVKFLRQHIAAVEQAASQGCNIVGYCVWAFTDLLSWLNGYQKRYGLVYVDQDESMQGTNARTPKDSYYWYQSVIASDGRVL